MSLRLDSIISSAVCSLLDPHPLLTPLQPPLWQTHLNPQALPTIPFSAMRTNTVFLLQDLGKSLPINLHVPIRPSSSTPLPQLLGRLSLVLLLDLSPHTRTFFSPSCPCVCQLRHDTSALRPDLHRTLALLSTLLALPALSHLSPRCCPPRGVPVPRLHFVGVDVPPGALCSETYNPASFCFPLPFSALLLRLPGPGEHNHGAPLSTTEGET